MLPDTGGTKYYEKAEKALNDHPTTPVNTQTFLGKCNWIINFNRRATMKNILISFLSRLNRKKRSQYVSSIEVNILYERCQFRKMQQNGDQMINQYVVQLK